MASHKSKKSACAVTPSLPYAPFLTASECFCATSLSCCAILLSIRVRTLISCGAIDPAPQKTTVWKRTRNREVPVNFRAIVRQKHQETNREDRMRTGSKGVGMVAKYDHLPLPLLCRPWFAAAKPHRGHVAKNNAVYRKMCKQCKLCKL